MRASAVVKRQLTDEAEALRRFCQAVILLRQGVFVRDASVQALSMQDTEFDFSHIEPTAMLGSVMDFEFGGNAAGLGPPGTLHTKMRVCAYSDCPSPRRSCLACGK